MNRKALIAAAIEEAIDDLTYYHRVEDPDLPNFAIEQMIENGEITVDEIVTMFKNALIENLALTDQESAIDG